MNINDLPDETKITALKPFRDCQCKGHKNNWLEDPMDTVGDRKMLIRILDGYYPQAVVSESEKAVTV